MAETRQGRFITFEGPDGVGKSTQLANLAAHLRKHGITVITTREPGGTEVGQKLRSILLNSRTAGLTPLAELALMFADRSQHVDEQIVPALQRGQWVLCDRFTDSSEAYQGSGRKLGPGVVQQLHKLLCRDLQPDLTILMISDIGHTINRARRRNVKQALEGKSDENRFEEESRAFHQRVLDAYLAIAKREPRRVVQVNAKEPIAVVQKIIATLVDDRFKLGPHPRARH